MISVVDLEQAFSTVMDEFQTAQFDSTEKSIHLNQAQDFWFQRWTKPLVMDHTYTPTVSQAEEDMFVSKALMEFTSRILLTTPPSGTLIANTVGPNGRDLVALNATGRIAGSNKEFAPIRFRTRTEARIGPTMEFYAPNASNIYFEIVQEVIQFYPKTAIDIQGDFLYAPRNVDIDTLIDSDFPDFCKWHIVYKACKFAAEAVRDYQFAQAMEARIIEL